LTATLRTVSTFKDPETASTEAEACATGAELEAERIKVAGVPGTTVREAGVAVTPVGRPLTETETEPVKPFCAVTETCIVWDPP
jgi:hypothetical protein